MKEDLDRKEGAVPPGIEIPGIPARKLVNHLKGVNTYVVFWVFHSNNGTSFLWASFLAFSSASAARSLRAR